MKVLQIEWSQMMREWGRYINRLSLSYIGFLFNKSYKIVWLENTCKSFDPHTYQSCFYILYSLSMFITNKGETYFFYYFFILPGNQLNFTQIHLYFQRSIWYGFIHKFWPHISHTIQGSSSKTKDFFLNPSLHP